MIKSNISVDIRDFERLSLIKKDKLSHVFLVKNKNTGKTYTANNFLINLNDLTEQSQSDLEHCFKSLSEINHPSIATFRGFSNSDFNEENRPVIITDYARNGTLRDAILDERSRRRPEGWTDTAKLV